MNTNRKYPAESIKKKNNVSDSVTRVTVLLFLEFVLNVIIFIETA